MKRILIVGATSAIAVSCARRWAEDGASFFLVGRHADRLDQVAQDLVARGAKDVSRYVLDMNDFGRHTAMLDACTTHFAAIDIALVAHGTLSDQKACEQDVTITLQELSTNALSVIALLTPLANLMSHAGQGVIAVIGSVAGDRGRPSNYVYGTAKSALSTFCEGLRARLSKVGVHVVTVKPGFVDTPMTAGLPLPGPLVATPDKVASDIVRAVEKRRDVVYTPWFWAGIMLIIRAIPTRVFKRLSL
ncbi:SDR family oxidoreductase [Burkholderia multivorans]|uniref:SDR family oxidoreductase n=1 Tax=Burkholderia multivorans TaxID=87883 RepID=UPI0012DDE3B8|nr:SDR family oxidoreductase [Burkholderia multivorans]MBU9340288.1 SDR family oxidoreductase [Burkholderia multivorans]MCA8141196.1 SDR family oxidoreductase [Burkholderia multivorans]QGR60028.1 SDR family oxidoreductase [Burkholderia multivorans]WVN03368.1 SDR family oxidoreductase [Burkholderia multivorans]